MEISPISISSIRARHPRAIIIDFPGFARVGCGLTVARARGIRGVCFTAKMRFGSGPIAARGREIRAAFCIVPAIGSCPRASHGRKNFRGPIFWREAPGDLLSL